MLLIDGCNGPMRLDRRCLLDSKEKGHAISLLRVVGDENRGERLWLIEALDLFLSRQNWRSEICFDGVGVDNAKGVEELQGLKWKLSQRIVLQVTPTFDEADNVMVEHVVRNAKKVENSRISQDISLADAVNLVGKSSEWNDEKALTIWRNGNGCGKSRRVVKRYGLMRPETVFCLFGVSSPNQVHRDVQAMSNIRNLLSEPLLKQSIIGEVETTIVVTDDIFLRQRVVQSGGLVMTFEQLWELLAPFARDK
jgi:hypothetical protein